MGCDEGCVGRAWLAQTAEHQTVIWLLRVRLPYHPGLKTPPRVSATTKPAGRSQANTAKLLETSPTLMRLRELEVLEKIASAGKLNVVLGEKGLAERVINLL